jgi:hypothetical protein
MDGWILGILWCNRCRRIGLPCPALFEVASGDVQMCVLVETDDESPRIDAGPASRAPSNACASGSTKRRRYHRAAADALPTRAKVSPQARRRRTKWPARTSSESTHR